MRRIFVANLESKASAVGMGCSSLGSRVGRREGLKALDRAFDAGITWFDVAPSYGDAGAETILGEFARDKRDRLQICTKVGILPARRSFMTRAAKPILRLSVNAVPMLRKYVAKARPVSAKSPISAKMIVSSVDASLQRLRTDHVEVLALHGATPQEVVQEDVLAALERVVRLGKAKTVSIASSLECGLFGVAHSKIYEIIQVANNPFEPSLAQEAEGLSKGRKVTFVAHSAYGAFGALSKLCGAIESNPNGLQMLREEGYDGNTEQAAIAFLADYAFATNQTGITLFSMLKKAHLEFNLQRFAQMRDQNRMKKIAQALVGITDSATHGSP